MIKKIEMRKIIYINYIIMIRMIKKIEMRKRNKIVNPQKGKTSQAAYRPVIKSCVINININSASYLSRSQKMQQPSSLFQLTLYLFPSYCFQVNLNVFAKFKGLVQAHSVPNCNIFHLHQTIIGQSETKPGSLVKLGKPIESGGVGLPGPGICHSIVMFCKTDRSCEVFFNLQNVYSKQTGCGYY